eukprot:768015-Hanusia_phi.AAC.3
MKTLKVMKIPCRKELSQASARQASHHASEEVFLRECWQRNLERDGIRFLPDRNFRQPIPFISMSAGSDGRNSASSNLQEIPPTITRIDSPGSYLNQTLHQLMHGSGRTETFSAITVLTSLVEGDTERARAARRQVAKTPAVVEGILRYTRVCDQAQKTQVYKCLSQLALYNEKVCLQILSDLHGVASAIKAASNAPPAAQIEIARLLNNLCAYESAAEMINANQSFLDMIKRFCSSPSFLVRFRALSAINALSRFRQVRSTLQKMRFLEEAVLVMNVEGGDSDQRAIFEFIQACATLNLLPLQDRKGFKVEKNVLATSLRLLSYSLLQKPCSGISFRTIHLFQAINNFLNNEENKVLLFRMGLVDSLVDYTRKWSEDPLESLNDQLEVLELAFQMILSMSSLHACKILLRRHNFGSQIMRYLNSKPSDIVLKYCKSLVEELKYIEEPRDFLVRPKTSMSPNSTMGASRTIPRTTSGRRLRTISAVSTSSRREVSQIAPKSKEESFSPLKVEPFKRSLRISLFHQAARRWKAVFSGLQDMCSKTTKPVQSDVLYNLLTTCDVIPSDKDWELFLEQLGAEPTRGCSPNAVFRAFCAALGQPEKGQELEPTTDQREEVLRSLLLHDLSRFERRVHQGCQLIEDEDVTISTLAGLLRELGWTLHEEDIECVRMACSTAHSHFVDVRKFRETLHELVASLITMRPDEAMEEISYETGLRKWMKDAVSARRKSLSLRVIRPPRDFSESSPARRSTPLVHSSAGTLQDLSLSASSGSF